MSKKARFKEDNYDFPMKPNELMVGEYLQSKFECGQSKRAYEHDKLYQNVTINKVLIEQELNASDRILKERQEEALRKRVELDKEWEALNAKELSLKERFIAFHKFVKENALKRERAIAKSIESKELKKEREEAIKELQEKYDRLLATKKSMEEKIQDFKIYEVFLKEVCNSNSEFKTINDIIMRYEILVGAKIVLGLKLQNDMAALEKARYAMNKMIADFGTVSMGLKTRCTNLSERYERAKQNCLHWEYVYCKLLSNGMERYSSCHEVERACKQLYQKICERKGIPPRDLSYNEIFQFIKAAVVELRTVSYKIKKRQENLERSSATAGSKKRHF